MKKMLILFLSIVLIAGLSLVSCQKKEPATKEKASTDTTGYGEKAEEAVEKAKAAVAGYGEKTEELVEKTQKTVVGYGKKVEQTAEKVQETLSRSICNAPIPNLLGAVTGDGKITITWSDRHTGDPSVTGYNIYYDQDGTSQPATSVPPRTMYTDTGLTNGQEYCYKVTSLHAECESGFSNIICAVPGR